VNEREELEARLIKARSRKLSLVAEREARAEAERFRAEVEEAEQSALDEEAIAKAEGEHGPVGARLRAVPTPLGVVIVKRPNHLMFRKFMDAGSLKTVDLEKLVRSCLVHPSAQVFDRILEEVPAVVAEIANECAALAGAQRKELGGK
jgi:hypothetical protein